MNVFSLTEFKTFRWSELSGKTLKIKTNVDKHENGETLLTMGYDIDAGEIYVLNSFTKYNKYMGDGETNESK